MCPPEANQPPAQVEAAFRFLKFIEKARANSESTADPRPHVKTELEVQDSALTVLLEYFNLPLAGSTPQPPCSSFNEGDDIPF